MAQRRLKNLTITVTEEVARRARLLAAERAMSVSRFVGDLLAERVREEDAVGEAWERLLSLPPRALSDGSPYPTRGELYDREPRNDQDARKRLR